MMRQYELVDRVKRYNPHTDEDLLNKAYVYAMRAHGVQKRASGDLFFSHPLEVAAILTDQRLDDATIVAAVLHDTIEDTSATREEIEQIFGKKIADLVHGLTKLKKLDLVSKQAEQAENFRKLLLAVASDIRVLLIKLADRLHNMRTLQHMKPEKRTRIAEETLDIYAPLAARMGMQAMRNELEELSFKHLRGDAHAMILARLEDLRTRNGPLITRIEAELTEQFRARGIVAEVKGRQKQPYSVWRKMERKSVSFEQLSDIYGFRIIVDTVANCYTALGVVHTTWPTVPGRFKDFISNPKENDYASLHTTVVGPGRQRAELQIRTRAMQEVAEFGIAAHATYKEGRTLDDSALARESRAYQWLRDTVEHLAESDSSEEFLKQTKLEMFVDQVFCFTPKGTLIALPRGATTLDFAYAVHTDVGNSAVGAKINGTAAPLMSELHNGDEVQILCTKGQSPPAAWETLVVTGRARAAIRRATRDAVRKQFSGLGRTIVERAFVQAGKSYSDDKLKSALPRLARNSVDDVLAEVGRTEMSAANILKALYPDYVGERREERKAGPVADKKEGGWFGLKKAASLMFKVPGTKAALPDTAIPIRGLRGDLPVRFAPNGGAVPGDRIVGILTPGEGVTIYPIQSNALVAFEDQMDRWLDVRWEIEPERKEQYPAQIVVTALHEPGALADIAGVIGENGGNIENVSMTTRSADFREMLFDLMVWDLQQLTRIISQLRTRKIISKVERVNG